MNILKGSSFTSSNLCTFTNGTIKYGKQTITNQQLKFRRTPCFGSFWNSLESHHLKESSDIIEVDQEIHVLTEPARTDNCILGNLCLLRENEIDDYLNTISFIIQDENIKLSRTKIQNFTEKDGVIESEKYKGFTVLIKAKCIPKKYMITCSLIRLLYEGPSNQGLYLFYNRSFRNNDPFKFLSVFYSLLSFKRDQNIFGITHIDDSKVNVILLKTKEELRIRFHNYDSNERIDNFMQNTIVDSVRIKNKNMSIDIIEQLEQGLLPAMGKLFQFFINSTFVIIDQEVIVNPAVEYNVMLLIESMKKILFNINEEEIAKLKNNNK